MQTSLAWPSCLLAMNRQAATSLFVYSASMGLTKGQSSTARRVFAHAGGATGLLSRIWDMDQSTTNA
jgi:hypothetical protein